jgi:uncharacterized protein
MEGIVASLSAQMSPTLPYCLRENNVLRSLTMPVRMELSRILIRELKDYQLIQLREVTVSQDLTDDGLRETISQKEDGRAFPIVIGLPEALAIERRLKGITISRPQTHDLLVNVMTALGAKLTGISITDLKESTFFAVLHVQTADGQMIDIDSRPSDAIAMGIAGSVPIYVEEAVLDAVQADADKFVSDAHAGSDDDTSDDDDDDEQTDDDDDQRKGEGR